MEAHFYLEYNPLKSPPLLIQLIVEITASIILTAHKKKNLKIGNKIKCDNADCCQPDFIVKTRSTVSIRKAHFKIATIQVPNCKKPQATLLGASLAFDIQKCLKFQN